MGSPTDSPLQFLENKVPLDSVADSDVDWWHSVAGSMLTFGVLVPDEETTEDLTAMLDDSGRSCTKVDLSGDDTNDRQYRR
jgi:hypothetical protein